MSTEPTAERIRNAATYLESCPEDCLGRNPQDGYYYRDEMIKRLRMAANEVDALISQKKLAESERDKWRAAFAAMRSVKVNLWADPHQKRQLTLEETLAFRPCVEALAALARNSAGGGE